jgi:hypothetical protein
MSPLLKQLYMSEIIRLGEINFEEAHHMYMSPLLKQLYLSTNIRIGEINLNIRTGKINLKKPTT